MGSSNKSSRIATRQMCREFTKRSMPDIETKTQQLQEDAMWKAFRAENARIAQENPYEDDSLTQNLENTDYDDIHEEETDFSDTFSHESGYSRFCSAIPRDTHRYPTGKPGQTTKDRRYNPTVKKSDDSKIHGKLKGKSHSKMMKDGIIPSIEDVVNPGEI